LVLPLVMVGITLAIGNAQPGDAAHAQACVHHRIRLGGAAILHVPTGWKIVVAMSPERRASSSSLWYCTPGRNSRGS
jgi:hypothetical protein